MTIEQTQAHILPKPWGSTDLRPWNAYHDGSAAIGEIWFERIDTCAPCPALLVKLLFTKERLSIQVHPDDAFARSIGLPHGKSEAWYVLSAMAGAEIALGLKRQLTPRQLLASIHDGSIAQLVQWREVRKGDIAFVPPGTIHAIGAGVVIVEVQQRSDATFRLFDYGRPRELHAAAAVAAASPRRSPRQVPRRKLTPARTLLVASLHFVLERLTLAPESHLELDAAGETWLFILAGRARVGSIDVGSGSAVFLEADRARIETGPDGLESLLAYVGSRPIPDLLRTLSRTSSRAPAPDRERARSQPNPMSGARGRPAEAQL